MAAQEAAKLQAAQAAQPQDGVLDDVLDLQSRSLTALPPLPTTLLVLNLTRNRISDLAPCARLVNLERLDCSRNKVRVLPHAVAALPRLKELLLYSNHLQAHRPARENPSAARGTRPRVQHQADRRRCQGGDLRAMRNGNNGARLAAPGAAAPGRHGRLRGDARRERLEAQLQPWSTPQLRRRLSDEFSVLRTRRRRAP